MRLSMTMYCNVYLFLSATNVPRGLLLLVVYVIKIFLFAVPHYTANRATFFITSEHFKIKSFQIYRNEDFSSLPSERIDDDNPWQECENSTYLRMDICIFYTQGIVVQFQSYLSQKCKSGVLKNVLFEWGINWYYLLVPFRFHTYTQYS